MRIRIPLIVCILAGLVVTSLNLVKIRDEITLLHSRVRQETAAREKAEVEAAAIQKQLAQNALALKETKIELLAAEAAKEEANASLKVQIQRVEKLGTELADVGRERDEVQVELRRYQASLLSAQQVANIQSILKTLQRDIAALRVENTALSKQPTQASNRLPGEEPVVLLPAELQGRVLISDPKWQFVVLDAGKDQGVLRAGELLVSRAGKLVAKVKVDQVEKDRSVARVMAGWQLGEIMEGDLLIPAYPEFGSL
jgi:hypothetical protein